MKRMFVLVAAFGLGACSSARHCEREQPYQRAETVAPMAPIDGVAPPMSPSALRIPDAPASATPFAIQEADPDRPDRQRVRCLDVPPPIAPQHLVIPEA